MNWSKSQVLVLDAHPPGPLDSQVPIPRASLVRYLGVLVTRHLSDYYDLNLAPLIPLIKAKTQIWAKLPLGVMGRINLIKMILLPKLLYLLWHAPLYIPLRLFKTVDSILNSFVCGHSRHKLGWLALQNPSSLGGASVPNFRDYYLASQLSHLYHLEKMEKRRYQALVCQRLDQGAFTPIQAIIRGNLGDAPRRDRNSILSHF